MDRRNRLRMMAGSEIIDVAVRVYQVLGWSFLRLSVLPSLFCLAAVTFFFRYVLPNYFVTSHPGSQSAQLAEMLTTTGLAIFVAAPLFLLGTSYTSAMVSSLVADYMLGNAPDPDAADRKGRLLLWRLFLLSLRIILFSSIGLLAAVGLLALAGVVGSSTPDSDALAGGLLVIAVLALCVATLVFFVVLQKFALAPAAMVLENLKVGDASRRSIQLLRGTGAHPGGGGTVWGLYFLILLLLLPVWGGIASSLDLIGYPDTVRSYLAGIPFAPYLTEALGLLPLFLVIWTLTPVWASATTILYFDRRIRLEGYDIEALAEDIWRADSSRRFEL